MQQRGGVFFDQDPALEIQPRREAEIFVVRAGEAVDAAMTASPVRVDARVEADVGAVVAGNDRTGSVAQVDRLRTRLLGVRPLVLRLDLDPLEAILGITRRPATDDASPIPLWFFHRLILIDPCLPHYTHYSRTRVLDRIEEYYRPGVLGEQRSAAATTRALADSTDGKRVPAVGVGAVIDAFWQSFADVPEYDGNSAPKTLR